MLKKTFNGKKVSKKICKIIVNQTKLEDGEEQLQNSLDESKVDVGQIENLAENRYVYLHEFIEKINKKFKDYVMKKSSSKGSLYIGKINSSQCKTTYKK